MFNSLRAKIQAMASQAVSLIKKTDNRYVEDTTQYVNSDNKVVDTDKLTVASGSNGEYYLIDKGLKKSDEAEFNLQKMAVSLRNLENRFGKHGFNILDQLNKMIELVNSNQPCDPAWAEKFLNDLAEGATTLKRVADRNASKFEDWSSEPTTSSSPKATTSRVWSPV